MRKFVFCMTMLLSVSLLQAQVIELKEARVEYYPDLKKGSDNSYSYVVKEAYTGEFSADALGFVKANFDIRALLNSIDLESDEGYVVTFENSKGHLSADYSKEGELLCTRQTFRDILVPDEVRRELYRSHKGWAMVKNHYTARGKADGIDRENYRVKMKNGKKSKVVNIDPKKLGNLGIASN